MSLRRYVLVRLTSSSKECGSRRSLAHPQMGVVVLVTCLKGSKARKLPDARDDPNVRWVVCSTWFHSNEMQRLFADDGFRQQSQSCRAAQSSW